MTWKTLLSTWILISLLIAPDALAGTKTKKVADIKKLLQLSNVEQTGLVMAEKNFSAFMDLWAKSKPQYKLGKKEIAELWDMYSDTMKSRMYEPGGLIDMLVPLYDKYFTHEEIKEIIRYAESPTGKKAARLGPVLAKEAWEVGAKWGRKIDIYLKRDVDNYLKKRFRE